MEHLSCDRVVELPRSQHIIEIKEGQRKDMTNYTAYTAGDEPRTGEDDEEHFIDSVGGNMINTGSYIFRLRWNGYSQKQFTCKQIQHVTRSHVVRRALQKNHISTKPTSNKNMD